MSYTVLVFTLNGYCRVHNAYLQTSFLLLLKAFKLKFVTWRLINSVTHLLT